MENLPLFFSEIEEQKLKETSEKKRRLREAQKMKSNLDYEQSRDFAAMLAPIEEAIQKLRDNLSGLQQKAEKMTATTAALESKSKAEVSHGAKKKYTGSAIEELHLPSWEMQSPACLLECSIKTTCIVTLMTHSLASPGEEVCCCRP